MKTNTQMMDLILQTAQNDMGIRAVILNGSRANPNAPTDMFADYDIVYVVADVEGFTSNHSWIDIFDSRIMLQMPETMRGPIGDGRFIYLMLLSDGNRTDLQLILIPVRKPENEYEKRMPQAHFGRNLMVLRTALVYLLASTCK